MWKAIFWFLCKACIDKLYEARILTSFTSYIYESESLYALIDGVQFSHQQRARYCHHQRQALLAINIDTWYCQSTSTRGVCHQQEFVVFPSTTTRDVGHQQQLLLLVTNNDTRYLAIKTIRGIPYQRAKIGSQEILGSQELISIVHCLISFRDFYLRLAGIAGPGC